MNIRFKNAKILQTNPDHTFDIIEGELWVAGDEIAYVGDGSHVPAGAPIAWDETRDCEGNLLMPGFKDAHTHTAMTFLRSYADDLPLSDWLNKQVFPREAQLTADDIYWLSILGIMEYLTSGITSNFDMYFHPRTIAKASNDCGFRTVQTSGLNNFSTSLEEQAADFEAVNAMGPLQSFLLGFHAEYTTSKEIMEGLAQLCQKYQSPCWLHNSETQAEVEGCKERYGMTPTELTESLGMYEYGGGGYHCVWFSDHDFEIFKKHGLTAVTNPCSNLKLASGIAPIQRFIKEGINVAIGTDGPASNNALDMWREMYLTSTLSKVREMDAASIKADEILYAATAGGAKAMGLSYCDRLEAGKKADIIMIDLKQPNMQPENNLVKNLVYAGGKQNVVLTMVNGRILYENGKYDIGFDPAEIYAKANAVIQRMQ